MPVKDAPTSEIGALRDTPIHVPGAGGMLRPGTWGSFHDDVEINVDLKWPRNVRIFEDMLNDGQIEALADAIRLPLYRRRWMIDRNGARPTVVKGVATDLGLPVKGDKDRARDRMGGRFSWRTHLEHVLDAPFYGHYFFEQVGDIGPDGLWHLRKLAPRPPRSIMDISVAQDGGLEWIRQNFATTARDRMGLAPVIPVTRLAVYVWQKRAANWVGRSMLRSVYKHWLAKDVLIRTDITKHQRNGMGVPTAKATDKSVEPAQLAAAHRVAQAWQVGQDSSAALPFGTDIELKGVTGSLPDTLASIRYHDEQMARRFLAMFLQLGQTETGSRALGESFMDFFALSLDAVAGWVCDVTNEHVIEDWVDWNYGPDEKAPRLVSERDEEPELTVTDMVALIDAHALTVDDDLETMLRARYQLPERNPDQAARTVPAAVPPVLAPAARARASAAATVPDRALRRDPNAHEQAAAVDFAVLEQTFTTAVDLLVKAWQTIRGAQTDELVTQVENAGSLQALTGLQATTQGADIIAEILAPVAADSVAGALAEAEHQGVTVPEPDPVPVEARANATAALLAQSLSEAARRKAVQVAGDLTPMGDVAVQVHDHLESLSDTYLEDQFSGAVTAAQNGGRKAVMDSAERTGHAVSYYSSALLDASMCENCAAADGKQYASLADVIKDFPTGGRADCKGGPRCRCSPVAVYGEAAPTMQ